ncbi:MAG TPA: nicotinate-nucleotide--dimethylbenzimidazole phosphoribosyltransferase [Soehngenia sp.]|nr:nicotinate-nucleotide--dimethylbenzimidazole phosphoribosyltransferase [Soehngenia sp.]HPP32214.1 nicotinate-nucleotide--dimethylbenzimidazole phosphoribosyltransferase [Soehngenia sp.]
MDKLNNTLNSIKFLDEEAMNQAKKRWDSLVKPIGSLGLMEEITIRLAGIYRTTDFDIDKRAVVVMASDNGVVEENVASSPQIFTKILAEKMAKGMTGVSVMSKAVDADVIVVDIGINGDVKEKNVINRKIRYGTDNFTKAPAMTYDETIKAIEIGIEIADDLFNKGYKILGTGEVGIGNTTTSAAIIKTITDFPIDDIVGKGAGITDEQLVLKKKAIIKAIELHKPNRLDVIDVLSKVGGLDIAGLVGVYLSGAKNSKPVVMDGFISQAAALCAIKLDERVKDYIIPSHLSKEPGAKFVFNEIGLKPMLDLSMRLGEGTGCPLAFQIIDTSIYTLNNMATFEEAEMEKELLVDISKDEEK